ncbi:hypothetical protein V496_07010 [Pseudogymnoascus sp. VKM F-4515 (FW-2607)]|nr:hypothetical protein V496_07010 [Pseudogymnoascus sp. VKM F-4515 (FW-2607)]KFY76018.1 hypothetical protein V498_09791 [Pseudogymnoascus sp. VKM F-4517 (FW-2822)]
MAQPQDAAAYYGDLLDSDKKPSRVMVALLTGIAKYIVKNLGDKDTKCLTPPKLAAFYKAVGGNYDSVFIDLPNPQISFIYQSIGCQHTLQPTEDDFHAPSIPALTTRGFVRWQTIEILLDPSGHVPFLQRAVHDFPILNPETCERFPADLPASCLPQEPDAAIEKWHNKCAEKLRRDSAADERPRSQPNHTPDSRHQSPYVKTSHTHPTTAPPRDAPRGADNFNPKAEHPRRQKLNRAAQAPKPRDPPQRRAATPPLEYEDARGRRRSVPKDYYRNIPADSRPSKYPFDVPQEGLRPHSGGPGGRHHSHPRQGRERSSSSSSWSSSSESVTTDPPTSPLYTARRASKSKDQPQPQPQPQQQGNPGKSRRGPKPTTIPFVGRYSASSSPHPDPVAAAASAAAAAAAGLGGLQNEKLRQDHRNRGLSMPNFRHAAGGGPQIATYKIAVDPPPPSSGAGPFTPSYPPNAWRSESRGGGANVRWRDLVDIDIPLGAWVKEPPVAPDAPPAVGGGGGMGEKVGREKYRREEFGRARERRSVSHEERVRLRERERRDWERERERADSETDARLDRRFGGRR